MTYSTMKITDINQKLKVLIVTAAFTASLTSCGSQVDNNVPGVPATGFFASVGANQHNGSDSVQVAAAIFLDGNPVDMVGGDVIQASNPTDSVLLLDRGYFEDSYSAILPKQANLDQVDFLIVHDPIGARKNRWYPGDLIYTDPGQGDLVGSAANIILPPGMSIIAPVNGDIFTDITDTFTLSWTVTGAGDTMKIYSAVTCDDGVNISTYGTKVKMADVSDDGIEVINLNEFIYDLNSNPVFDFIDSQARAMLRALLEQLSNGATDDAFFANFARVNPISSNCEIRLFLFRHRVGSFVSAGTNGNIFGSRSSEVMINYSPP